MPKFSRFQQYRGGAMVSALVFVGMLGPRDGPKTKDVVACRVVCSSCCYMFATQGVLWDPVRRIPGPRGSQRVWGGGGGGGGGQAQSGETRGRNKPCSACIPPPRTNTDHACARRLATPTLPSNEVRQRNLQNWADIGQTHKPRERPASRRPPCVAERPSNTSECRSERMRKRMRRPDLDISR